jgi:uracil-DNA glycosylase family 4
VSIEHANHVPGCGPLPSEWVVVGEGPGKDEDRKGEPFVGKTGDEMRRYMDGESMPAFDDCYRTYIYRYYGGKDYEFTEEDFQRDEPELLDELRAAKPQVIIAVGRHATRYFLGDVSMDEVHGLPWYLPEDSRLAQMSHVQQVGSAAHGRVRKARRASRRTDDVRGVREGTSVLRDEANTGRCAVVVFPCYHPAAGFRSPEASALVSYDFAQLALFAADELTPRKLHDDPIPNPQYFHVESPSVIKTFAMLSTIKKIYSDSEGYARKPWSVQWSLKSGTGYLLKAENLNLLRCFLDWIVASGATLIFHNSLHDRAVFRSMARLCGWSEQRILFELDQVPFGDTMVMAYLLQLEPQGLKGLATRHANMSMMSYDELMGDKQNDMARDHLFRMWDLLWHEYEQAQHKEFEKINRTPLLDKKTGKPKRNKDGSIRCRRTSVLPKVPKSDLFKAVERCCKAKEPHRLYADQREDILVEGYHLLGDMPETTLDDVDFPTALRYGARDSDATARVEPELEKRIDAMKLRDVYELELSTYPLIDRMMTVGMRPNLDIFAKLSEKLHFEIADLQVAIEEATGIEGFNANSGDQVAAYLFDTLELTPLKMTSPGGNKEPRGSTNDKILETLEKEHGADHPVISTFRDYREVYKLKHTFVDRIPDFVNRYPFDGRVHATFRTTRVITGRLAASDPNVLAQPEHGKFAKDFKAGWEAAEGHVVCNWDLSQVELRVLAHLSQDPVLMKAYTFECPHEKEWQGGKTLCKRDACVLQGDLHAKLAHMVFGIQPSNQDDSKHRLPAKTHNFGLAMGITCHGLMIELRKNGVEVDEDGAQEWIDASNKLYKKVPHYKAEKIAEARRNGFVRCLSGRIRYIGGIRSRDERLRAEAERFAFSTPIQEGAQRSMKEAEAYIYRELLLKKYYRDGYYMGGPKGRYVEPLCQVHDALKFEVAEGLQDVLNTEMIHAMTKVPTQLSVPLGVEGKFGPNFRDMRKFGGTA